MRFLSLPLFFPSPLPSSPPLLKSALLSPFLPPSRLGTHSSRPYHTIPCTRVESHGRDSAMATTNLLH